MGLKRPVFDRQDMRPAMLVLAFLAQYLLDDRAPGHLYLPRIISLPCPL